MASRRGGGRWRVLATAMCMAAVGAGAQDMLPGYRGDEISPEIESMYTKGLAFLANTQSDQGSWPETHGTEPGVVGLAVLAMLAHGEDPNFGPYSKAIRKGLEFIIKSASRENGYIGSSMYNHGFATLALAEAYGSVDDSRIGPTLKKAVGLILTSQSRNSTGGWRYSPESTDADTTISGAQMVALLAARNAGIGVPERAISTGLSFYRRCQTPDGGFGYTAADGAGPARSAIGALVFALAKQKDSREFKAAVRYLQQASGEEDGYLQYYMYYASQALFHADMEVWKTWNERNVKLLKSSQTSEGGWQGTQGAVFSTSAALLSLAVNYRFLPIYER